MNAPYLLRVAAIRDIDAILKIRKEGWLTTYVNPELGITRDVILTRDFDSPAKAERLIQRMQDSNRKIYVVTASNKVIGFCCWL